MPMPGLKSIFSETDWRDEEYVASGEEARQAVLDIKSKPQSVKARRGSGLNTSKVVVIAEMARKRILKIKINRRTVNFCEWGIETYLYWNILKVKQEIVT